MNKSKRISTILLATACCVTYNINVLAMEKDEISKEEFEKIR